MRGVHRLRRSAGPRVKREQSGTYSNETRGRAQVLYFHRDTCVYRGPWRLTLRSPQPVGQHSLRDLLVVQWPACASQDSSGSVDSLHAVILVNISASSPSITCRSDSIPASFISVTLLRDGGDATLDRIGLKGPTGSGPRTAPRVTAFPRRRLRSLRCSPARRRCYFLELDRRRIVQTQVQHVGSSIQVWHHGSPVTITEYANGLPLDNASAEGHPQRSVSTLRDHVEELFHLCIIGFERFGCYRTCLVAIVPGRTSVRVR